MIQVLFQVGHDRINIGSCGTLARAPNLYSGAPICCKCITKRKLMYKKILDEEKNSLIGPQIFLARAPNFLNPALVGHNRCCISNIYVYLAEEPLF